MISNIWMKSRTLTIVVVNRREHRAKATLSKIETESSIHISVLKLLLKKSPLLACVKAIPRVSRTAVAVYTTYHRLGSKSSTKRELEALMSRGRRRHLLRDTLWCIHLIFVHLINEGWLRKTAGRQHSWGLHWVSEGVVMPTSWIAHLRVHHWIEGLLIGWLHWGYHGWDTNVISFRMKSHHH